MEIEKHVNAGVDHPETVGCSLCERAYRRRLRRRCGLMGVKHLAGLVSWIDNCWSPVEVDLWMR